MDNRNQRRSDITANFAVGGTFVGGIFGATQVVHVINHTGQYNPLHNEVLNIQQDNQNIQGDLHDPNLQGFAGAAAVHNHLIGLQNANKALIVSLTDKEPKQVITQAPETAIELLTAALVAVVWRRARKNLRQPSPVH
jgi:hypothetical protein